MASDDFPLGSFAEMDEYTKQHNLPNPMERLRKYDRNQDGGLSAEELTAMRLESLLPELRKLDKNGDQLVTLAEQQQAINEVTRRLNILPVGEDRIGTLSQELLATLQQEICEAQIHPLVSDETKETLMQYRLEGQPKSCGRG